MKEKNEIEEAKKFFGKEFGLDFVGSAEDDNLYSGPQKFLPTGNFAMDAILGGGYPLGRIVEIFGDESTGKTLLVEVAAAQAQKAGGTAVLADAEAAYDRSFGERIGLDNKTLHYLRPNNIEQVSKAFDYYLTKWRDGKNGPLVLILDSLAAIASLEEEESGNIGEIHAARRASLIAQMLRRFRVRIAEANALLLITNQMRDVVGGATYGPKSKTTGGRALKFYSSVRISLDRAGKIKAGEKIVGIQVKIETVKNKLFDPFLHVNVDLLFRQGLEPYSGLVKLMEFAGLAHHLARGQYRYTDSKRKGDPMDFTKANLPQFVQKHGVLKRLGQELAK